MKHFALSEDPKITVIKENCGRWEVMKDLEKESENGRLMERKLIFSAAAQKLRLRQSDCRNKMLQVSKDIQLSRDPK